MASKADQTAKPITGGRSVVSIIGETYACPTHHHHHHQCCLHQSQIHYYHHHHHHHLYHWYSVPTAKIILLLSSSSPPWSMVVRKANYTKAGGHSYSPSNLPSLLLFHFFKASFEGTQRTEHGSDVERHHNHHHHHHQLHHHQREQASKRREQHNFDVDRRHLRLFGRRASSYGHVRTPHHQLKVMMMMTMTKLMITIMSYGQKV